MVNYID